VVQLKQERYPVGFGRECLLPIGSIDGLIKRVMRLAKIRRFTPNTLKNSFQHVWASARSVFSPFHSGEKATARAFISLRDKGMVWLVPARQVAALHRVFSDPV